MIETPKKASSSFLVTLSFKSTNTNQLHCPTSRPLCIIRYQQRSPVYNILIIYKLARTICYYCCGKIKCTSTLGRSRGWGWWSPTSFPPLLELFSVFFFSYRVKHQHLMFSVHVCLLFACIFSQAQ